MQKIYFPIFLFTAFLSNSIFAQNVGVGEPNPASKFEIKGDNGSNLLNVKDQGSVSKLFIDSDGKVGVSNQSPIGRLDVEGYITNKINFQTSSDQVWLLVENNQGSNNDIMGRFYIERSSGYNKAAIIDILVSTAGSSTNKGGFITTHQVDESEEIYSLVTLDYNGNSYIALRYQGNQYLGTKAYFNGYIKSNLGNEFLSLETSVVTNVANFGSTGSNNKYTIMADRVGIGKSNPSSSYLLDVNGTARYSDQVTIPLLPTAPAHAASKDYVDNQIGSITETDPTWSGAANTTSSIGRTGNVGIGTTNPSTSLEVRTEILINNTNSRGNAVLEINRGTDGKDRAIIEFANGSNYDWYTGIPYNCGGNTDQYVISSQPHISDCSSTHTPEFVLTSSGNIGVGVTNPSYKLHINGRIKTTGINETSDQRLKKNIKPLKNALEIINAIEGVSYYWRKDEFPELNLGDRKEIGVIAQQVEKILPEVVETDIEGYKSVQYSHLIPVLIEALKETAKELEELKSEYKHELGTRDCKIEKLNNDMQNLKSEVSEIRSMIEMTTKK